MKAYYTILMMFILVLTSWLEAGVIHIAVKEGDIAKINEILQKNPEALEEKNNLGLSPLNLAAVEGKFEIIEFLTEKGANINSGDNEGSNPLLNAAARGHLKVTEYFVDKGLDVNGKDDNGMTALLFAAGGKNPRIVKFLIEKGADIHAVTKGGMGTLLWAAGRGNTEIVNDLLEAGMDPNKKNKNGNTPLHTASSLGHMETIRLLVQKGGDVNCKNKRGESPIVWAVARDRVEVVNFLINKGAEWQGKNSEGNTLLHNASFRAPESVRLLLEKGLDVNGKDNQGQTPLHQATWGSDLDIIKTLLEYGADVNAVDNNGRTPLLNATGRESVAVVQMLLDKGAMSNAGCSSAGNSCTFDNGSSLHLAVRSGNLDMARVLIDSGAKVDVKEKHWGQTPLHFAALRGYGDVAEYLVNRKADINMLDNDKNTPLFYAQHYGHKKIVSLFKSHGAHSGKNNLSAHESGIGKIFAENQAKVWYLGHSGWAIKTRNYLFIIDYWGKGRKADLPQLANGWISPQELADLKVVVLSSHAHRDHYDPEIFEWAQKIEGIEYILGFKPHEISQDRYTYLPARKEYRKDNMNISSIYSNDSGVGFVIEADGLVMFHAGDHANRKRDFSGDYLKEIDFIRKKKLDIDLAFLPISGCNFGDDEAVKLGVYKTIDLLQPKIFAPMHAADNEHRYTKFVDAGKKNGLKLQMVPVKNKGDGFDYKRGVLAEKR